MVSYACICYIDVDGTLPVFAAAASKPAAGKVPVAPSREGAVFTLEPTSMDLAIDETQDLCLYAYPTAEGLVEDVVMCR